MGVRYSGCLRSLRGESGVLGGWAGESVQSSRRDAGRSRQAGRGELQLLGDSLEELPQPGNAWIHRLAFAPMKALLDRLDSHWRVENSTPAGFGESAPKILRDEGEGAGAANKEHCTDPAAHAGSDLPG